MCSSARSPGPTQVAAAMFTPASLTAVATRASAPGVFSMSMTKSTAMRRTRASGARAQVPQHPVQDAAVLEVGDLVRGVDPDLRLEGDLIRAVAVGGDLDGLRLAVLEIAHVEGLLAGQAERLDRLALRELEWQDAHPDQVGAVDPLEALGHHRADAEQRGSLRGPVPRGARAVLLAGQHHQRHTLVGVRHRGLVDRGLLAVRQVAGEAALALTQAVAEADVGEGAADHHLVVAAPRAVRVEVTDLDALLDQPPAGRAVLLDCPRGRDVIG